MIDANVAEYIVVSFRRQLFACWLHSTLLTNGYQNKQSFFRKCATVNRIWSGRVECVVLLFCSIKCPKMVDRNEKAVVELLKFPGNNVCADCGSKSKFFPNFFLSERTPKKRCFFFSGNELIRSVCLLQLSVRVLGITQRTYVVCLKTNEM